MIAVIGGSGFSKYGFAEPKNALLVETEYGSVTVYEINLNGKEAYFLPRHGIGHAYPPHLIPYKANLMALKLLGVERILATSAVGAINRNFKPGTIVLPDQFIDFTKGRDHTFSTAGKVYHLDFSEPFCPQMAEAVLKAAAKIDLEIFSGATYVVTEGPRFETPAEIRAFEILGGDLVGMTLVPECTLARELNLCYLTISTVTNMAAGISEGRLTASEVEEMMTVMQDRLVSLITEAAQLIPETRSCACKNAFEGAEI
jgi:5'-methylthioadenosine phosphorylase